MPGPGGSVAARRVLHVLPADLARGAQMYARELRDLLDGEDVIHRTLTLFAGPAGALRPDVSLAVRPGRLRRWAADPRAVLALRKELRRWKPDVVVAHGGEPLLYAALAARTRRTERKRERWDTPIVYYRVGNLASRARRSPRLLAYGWAARRSVLVAGVATETLDEARRVFRIDPDRIRVVPNGRSPERFHGDQRASDTGPVHLLWVGQLNDDKRPELFVAAVEALRERGRSLGATIVGDGPLLDRLTAHAAGADVRVPGRRDDVPELMADADIVCFTSRGPEGLPGVLIEAGFAARPVVATRAPGVDTVIEHGRTGLVVDVEDLDGLVESIDALIQDPGTRRRMGIAARERCLASFTMEASARRWREVLAELL